MSLKILIAEAREIFRIGLRSVLAADMRVSEIYEASNEREMQGYIMNCAPDLIIVNQDLLLDIAVLRAKHFVLIAYELDLFKLKEAYEVGASGYLSYNVSSELLSSLLSLKHTFLIEPTLVPKVMEYLFKQSGSPLLDENLLTPREKEIVDLLHEGIDRASIARQLCIAEATLKTHLKNIAKKRYTGETPAHLHKQKVSVLIGRNRPAPHIAMQGMQGVQVW